MEFWGVEVKPGETVKCEPEVNGLIHLSLSALGETKGKVAESVPIFVKINDQKLVIGSLSSEKCTHISYDLVFEKEFELSHNSKNTSVYFTGYTSTNYEDDEFSSDFDESDSEEDVPIASHINGKLKAKIQGEKPVAVKTNVDKEDNLVAKLEVKEEKSSKAKPMPDDDEDDDEDDDDYEGDDDSEGSDDDDENMMEAMGDSDEDDENDDSDDDDEDDESSEEEDDTPKKSANGKKRPVEPASKSPASNKKAKLATPAGDGKKGNSTANKERPTQQTPKSAGSNPCESCNKSFNSANALEAHTKAKHSGA